MDQFDLCPECGDSYGDFRSRISVAPNEMVEEYECISCDTIWSVVYKAIVVRWETYSGPYERVIPDKVYDPNEPF
jgi:uncharacterized iron-regulated protein